MTWESILRETKGASPSGLHTLGGRTDSMPGEHSLKQNKWLSLEMTKSCLEVSQTWTQCISKSYITYLDSFLKPSQVFEADLTRCYQKAWTTFQYLTDEITQNNATDTGVLILDLGVPQGPASAITVYRKRSFAFKQIPPWFLSSLCFCRYDSWYVCINLVMAEVGLYLSHCLCVSSKPAHVSKFGGSGWESVWGRTLPLLPFADCK